MSAPRSPTAQRILGFWTCTALVIGNTIGVGIFMMPAALAPYGLNAIVGWLVTAMGCGLFALVFSGLARAYPSDDGPYDYMERALGRGVAFVGLWCYWVSIWVTNAALAIGVVGYLAVLIPSVDHHPLAAPSIALAFVWSFVAINLCGIRPASWVQLVTTGIKLVPQLAIILVGGYWLLTQPAAFLAHVPPNRLTVDQVVQTSTIALFALLGIESAAIPAHRVRDPGRVIARATISGTLVTALLYICVSVIPILLIPQKQLASSAAPFSDLFSRLLGYRYGGALAAFVIVSGLGALNGWTLLSAEVARTLVRHGSLPTGVGVLTRRDVPARALVLTGLSASLMLVLNYERSLSGLFTFLIVVVTAADLPMYLACALAVLILWRSCRTSSQGRSWVVAAALGAVYCVWVFIGVGTRALLWAVVLGAVGVPLHLWSQTRRPAPPRS